MVGSVLSTVEYVQPWHENYDARRFLTTARQGLQAAPEPVPLADQPVPGPVVPALIFPYNLPSRVLSQIGGTFTTPDIATDIDMLDDNGAIFPGFATPDVAVPPRQLRACFPGGEQTVEFGSSTFDFPFWLSMSYRSDTGEDVGVTVGSTHYDGRIETGAHTLTFRTTGSVDRVVLDLPPGTRSASTR